MEKTEETETETSAAEEVAKTEAAPALEMEAPAVEEATQAPTETAHEGRAGPSSAPPPTNATIDSNTTATKKNAGDPHLTADSIETKPPGAGTVDVGG